MTTRPKNHPAVEAVARQFCFGRRLNPDAVMRGPNNPIAPQWEAFIGEAVGYSRAFLDATREPSEGDAGRRLVGREVGAGAMSCTPRVAAFPGADDDEKLAEFIAHARQDVPALIARVRELEGALQKIADLPLDDDVSVRRRRIALRALGATAQAVQKVADQVHTYIAAQAPGKDR